MSSVTSFEIIPRRSPFTGPLRSAGFPILLLLLCSPALRGQIFIRQESGTASNLYAVDFFGDSLGLAAGDDGTILRTTDGGSSWTAAPSGVTVSLRCVKWMSSSTAVAAGWLGTLLRSSDAGLTWAPESSGVAAPLSGCDAFDSLHAVVVGYGSTILVSADGGRSWETRLPGSGLYLFNGVACADSLTIVVASNSGRIVRSTDGGLSWTWQTFGGYTFSDVDFGDAENGMVVSASGPVLRTTDGGGTWTSLPSASYDDVEYASPAAVVAAGVGSAASSDGGTSWKVRYPPARFRSVAVFGPGDYLAVGDYGVILRTVMDSVDLPAPALSRPADGSTAVPLSPEYPEEFSVHVAWENYGPFLAEGMEVQVSDDSAFGQVTHLDTVWFVASENDTQRPVIHLRPGLKYYWRLRAGIEWGVLNGVPGWTSLSPWSAPRSFTGSVAESSRTIGEIQEVAHDDLLLADSLGELARDRWTLQASPLYLRSFFVTALCVASAEDLTDYLQGYPAYPTEMFFAVDTGVQGRGWGGMKFARDSRLSDGAFRGMRRGDVVVCSGFVWEFPGEDMNSETLLDVTWSFVVDSLGSVPAPLPAAPKEFFFMSGQDHHALYSGGEPLEGSIVEFTNLTVHSVDDASGGTFNVVARDGLTMSTADLSRWFTLRAHRDPASAYIPPFVGRHVDTLRGAIVTTSGSGNSWSFPRYRIAPIAPGDIVYGEPTGTLVAGEVFYDSSRNGIREADEAGIPGWKVFFGGLVSEALQTNAGGSYSAAGLDTGAYVVSLDVPAGWFVTTGNGGPPEISLGIGDTVAVPRFGLYYGWNSFAGTVFDDANENGFMDAGEAGIPGIAVSLAGATAESTMTDGAGNYSFERVMRGIYTVRAAVPPGWEQIVPFDRAGQTFDFTLYDQHVSGRDFSLRRSPPRVRVAVTVRDGGNDATRVIYFGARAGATHGVWGADTTSSFIDFSEGEFEIPPQAYGLFDARFVDPHGGWASFGEGSWTDIRDYVSQAQVDTYRIDFQPGYFFGGGYPIRLLWSPAAVDSAYAGPVTISDTLGNILVDMKLAGTLVVTDTTLGLLTLIPAGPVPRITDVPGRDGVLPSGYALYQNYPNPFNPSTEITFSLPVRTPLVLRIYDLLGRRRAALFEGTEGPGTYTVRWEPGGLPAGVYFCRMTAVGYEKTVKMLLLK